MSVTQRERVLMYIQDFGCITRRMAAMDLGCYELSSRIGELEAEGYKFKKTRCSGKNRYGDKIHWVRYELEE